MENYEPEYSEDRWIQYTICALEHYHNKPTTSDLMKIELKRIQRTILILFNGWEEVAEYKYAINFILDALDIYKKDFEDEFTIDILNEFDRMTRDLKSWRRTGRHSSP